MTGSIMFGSGCCNSISVPLIYTMNGSTLVGTVSGDPEIIGSVPADLPIGTEMTFKLENNQPVPGNASGQVIVQDNPFGYSEPIVWCTETVYDTRCGA